MEWLSEHWSYPFAPMFVLAWALLRRHARHVALEENDVTPAARAERCLPAQVQSRNRGLIFFALGLTVPVAYLVLNPRWYT